MSPPREPLSLVRYRYLEAPHRALRLRLFTIILRDQKPSDFRSLRPARGLQVTQAANAGGRYQPLSRTLNPAIRVSAYDYTVSRFASTMLGPIAPIRSVNYTADR